MSIGQSQGLSTGTTRSPARATARTKFIPPEARWIVERARALRLESLLQIVRALDSAMNNTSLILLLEVGKRKLLFPGDAQIENWEYALSQKKFQKLLQDVHLYKVGHHGSLNATPKTLWNLFQHRSAKPQSPNRLHTFVSTLAGKHGTAEGGSEVPRGKLVRALKAESTYFSTQELKRNEPSRDFPIEL
jgi:hypothetical protein